MGGKETLMKVHIIAFLLLAAVGSGAALEIESYSAILEIKGGYATQDISIKLVNNQKSPVSEFTYPFFGNVRETVVYGNGERIQFEKRASGDKVYIRANLSKRLEFNETFTLRYYYNITGIVERRDNLYILATTYPLFPNVKNFNLSIILPPGYVLPENEVSMSPEGEVTSDGRRLILRWKLREPVPSEFGNFRVIVLYESVAGDGEPAPLPYYYYVIPIIIIILISAAIKKRNEISKIVYNRRKRYEEKIDILKGDEQRIMRLIIENNGIDQREIVRKTGFSKTKVSKILSELEKRKAIFKEQVGRRNKVYLYESR